MASKSEVVLPDSADVVSEVRLPNIRGGRNAQQQQQQLQQLQQLQQIANGRPRSADLRPRSGHRANGDATAVRRSGWEPPSEELPSWAKELLLDMRTRLAALESVAAGDRTDLSQASDLTIQLVTRPY